jgi:hypothetical protein
MPSATGFPQAFPSAQQPVKDFDFSAFGGSSQQTQGFPGNNMSFPNPNANKVAPLPNNNSTQFDFDFGFGQQNPNQQKQQQPQKSFSDAPEDSTDDQQSRKSIKIRILTPTPSTGSKRSKSPPVTGSSSTEDETPVVNTIVLATGRRRRSVGSEKVLHPVDHAESVNDTDYDSDNHTENGSRKYRKRRRRN